MEGYIKHGSLTLKRLLLTMLEFDAACWLQLQMFSNTEVECDVTQCQGRTNVQATFTFQGSNEEFAHGEEQKANSL